MKSKINLISLLILLFIGIGAFLFFGQQKKGFHEDEYYSYYATNYTKGWGVGNGWVFSERYYNEFVVLPGEEFNYTLVKNLQAADVHPPMFYWVLHTVCSFWKNHFTKWQGLLVNLIFYLYGIIFMYLTCNELTDYKYPLRSFLFTLAYSLCSASLSIAMFVRMYAMFAGLVISSVYLHTKLLKNDKLQIKYLILIFLNLYIGALTHYYFCIYHFFMSAAVCIYMLVRDKKIKNCMIYGLLMVSGIALAVFTFPACLSHIFSEYRGVEAKSAFWDLSNTGIRIKTYLGFALNDIFINSIIAIVILALIILVAVKYKNKDVTNKYWAILLGAVIVGYYFIISKTGLMVGDVAVRYIFPVFSIIYIWLYFMICNFDDQKLFSKIVMIVTVVVLLGSDVYNICSNNIMFLYKEDGPKIEYAKAHSDIPVLYIYSDEHAWRYLQNADELLEYKLICFMSDASEEPIEDEYLSICDELLVYISNYRDIDKQINRVYQTNNKLDEYDLLFENKFCNLYYFH